MKIFKHSLLIMLFPLFSFSQEWNETNGKKWKVVNGDLLVTPKTPFITVNEGIVYALQFLAGAANGEHDRILYHPNQFFKDHPNLNMQWWDARISWKNKYNKSWFVRNFAVWSTDENHASAAVEHTAFILSFAITYQNASKNWKQNFKQAIKRALIAYGFNRAGFHAFYK